MAYDCIKNHQETEIYSILINLLIFNVFLKTV